MIPCGLCENNSRCGGLFANKFLLCEVQTLLYFLFYLSICLSLPLYFPILSCVFCCPDDLGAELFLWAREDTHCSHQNDLDKEPFLPSSWQQLPWKDAHMPKHFSFVQRSWFTHKPVGLKPPWNAKGLAFPEKQQKCWDKIKYNKLPAIVWTSLGKSEEMVSAFSDVIAK